MTRVFSEERRRQRFDAVRAGIFNAASKLAPLRIFIAHISRLASWGRAIVLVHFVYLRNHRRLPNLCFPRRYTEKVQWRKLFDLNPIFVTLSDKLAVRGFIASRVGEAYLAIGLVEEVARKLGGQAVLGHIIRSQADLALAVRNRLPLSVPQGADACWPQSIIIDQHEDIDPAEIRRQADAWLAISHAAKSHEQAYQRVPRQLIIEKKLTMPAGGAPEEVRLFIFDGKVGVLNTVIVENGRLRNGAFHTPEWKRLDWHFKRWVERPFPAPQRLAEMIRIAERIGAGLDHVRVDIYDCGGQIHVGEVTLYPWSGYSRFTPDQADFALGKYWRVRRPIWRAAQAVLLARRW